MQTIVPVVDYLQHSWPAREVPGRESLVPLQLLQSNSTLPHKKVSEKLVPLQWAGPDSKP